MLPSHHRSLILLLTIALTVGGVEALAQDAQAKLPVPDKRALEPVFQKLRKQVSDDTGTPEHHQPQGGASGMVRWLNKASELERGAVLESDPTVRFAMWSLAAELHMMGRNTGGAMIVADMIAKAYAVDPYQIKIDLIRNSGRSSSMMVQTVRRLVANAIAQRNWDAVERLAAGTTAWAQEQKRKGSATWDLNRLPQQIVHSAKSFRGIDAADAKLKSVPTDRAANLMAGRFHCFVVNDWAVGLPHLVAGSDARLAELARQDLADPTDPLAQAKLAEAWLAIGVKEPGISDLHIHGRAKHWYEHAVVQLDGEQREAVEERLREVGMAIAFGRNLNDRADSAPLQRLLAAIPKDLLTAKSQADRQRLVSWLRSNLTGKTYEGTMSLNSKGNDSSSTASRYLGFGGLEIVHGGVRYRLQVESRSYDQKTADMADEIDFGGMFLVRGTIADCRVYQYGSDENPHCSISLELRTIQVKPTGN